eukprot:6039336-Prymnesium_polylepis.1
MAPLCAAIDKEDEGREGCTANFCRYRTRQQVGPPPPPAGEEGRASASALQHARARCRTTPMPHCHHAP